MNQAPLKTNTQTKPALYFLDAHHCFAIECLIALFLFFALQNQIPFAARIVASWDGFALTGLLLTWATFFTRDPYEVRRRLRLSDTTRKFLFAIVILAAAASFSATWLLLATAKTAAPSHRTVPIVLALTTVTLSWFLVHTRFALYYANAYFCGAHNLEREHVPGGLIFPGKGSPDYLDFAYFSFVIGMTFQVSDVQISKHTLRRPATIHGLISFLFNTSILALVVNIVANLL